MDKHLKGATDMQSRECTRCIVPKNEFWHNIKEVKLPDF